MPRRHHGKNNRGHRRARKRAREQMDRELREARFRTMAEQNGLIYDPRRGFGVALMLESRMPALVDENGQPTGAHEKAVPRRDWYEEVIRQLRQSCQIPRDLLVGSAMGWLYERILGFERGEEERETKRQEAEAKYEDLLYEAALKQLHQWIPQPVPDDFVCPYTGNPVDKRKILASGTRSKMMGKSIVYEGHDTLVVYRTGHRGRWYVAREIWDGGRDHEGARVGVQIKTLPYGEVKVKKIVRDKTPSVPWRGIPGYSGQPGRPAAPDRSKQAARPYLDKPFEVIERTGYMSEADARKQTMLQILTAAAVMGMQHVNLRRASRMRGGARKEAEVSASAPYQTETVMERLTYTLPAHLWGGEIVETKAPHVRKKRRGEKEPEPEVPEPDLSEAARQRLMEAEHRIREKLLTDTQPIPSDW